jgi:hypothetical protein
LELSWTPGKIFLKSEYVAGRDGSTEKSGWYALAGAKINPAFDLVARFDTYDPSAVAANDRTNMTTFGVNWYLNKWAKIQTNYEIKTEETTQINNNVAELQAQVQF